MTLRVRASLCIAATLFFALILRLWYLQIMNGDYFRIRSENNRIRTIYVQPPRGLVYDRNHQIMVKNRPGFNIELVVEDSPHPKETLKTLAQVIGIPEGQILPKLNDSENSKRRRYETKLIMKDVSRDVVAKVLSHRYELPGIQVNVSPTREYVFHNLASHLLGYIREITKEQLDNSQYAGYRQGELVGQFGLENKLEHFLQGQRGIRAVIVDATGTRYGEAYYQPEQSGQNVSLTIDLDMQQAADRAMEGKRGAIVAMDVNSGEILAMASKPDFDPNVFTGELTPDLWQSLRGREKRLSNRVVQGGYPPGSVFKIFMAVAALTEKVTNKNEKIFCPGFLNFAGRDYRCHKHAGHGPVNMEEALIQSCDVYFYTMGQRLGVDRIHQYAKLFGLGTPTNLDLVPEHPGLIPSTEWKRKAFRKKEDQKWYAGETLSVAIGQGAVVTTPIQIARGLAALVNGGHLMRPYLVKSIDSKEDSTFGPLEERSLDLDKEAVEITRRGLEGVVADPRGTGHKGQLKELGISVAGKTGTAQVVSMSAGTSRASQLNDHAWFAAYAPADKPEIVVVALVENGGHGGATAAPLVKQVMETYFKKKQGPPKFEDQVSAKAKNNPVKVNNGEASNVD